MNYSFSEMKGMSVTDMEDKMKLYEKKLRIIRRNLKDGKKFTNSVTLKRRTFKCFSALE